jgi:hypothetical protein
VRALKVKRPKQYEDEPEPASVNIGSFDSFTVIPKDDKPIKKKEQIGFVRQRKKKRIERCS